ncbi:protein virilizer-like [Adelges cooleyi]|uniref:protein virilizer-like n=1 Tax=Adelges cooleyi TaxID=133065 RepID=UPI00217F2FCE|nr:protein virilizer-like [Adelges cooleyi]
MSSAQETLDLITFETFSHAFPRSNEICYDVMRFDYPVQLSEIRIIPSSMVMNTSSGEVPGSTNPTKFSVQFYINNINNESATTFENLGTFEYDANANIQYKCNSRIWSDRLIVSGSYTTISIATFGSLCVDPAVAAGNRTTAGYDFDSNITSYMSQLKLSSNTKNNV